MESLLLRLVERIRIIDGFFVKVLRSQLLGDDWFVFAKLTLEFYLAL